MSLVSLRTSGQGEHGRAETGGKNALMTPFKHLAGHIYAKPSWPLKTIE